MIDFCDLFLFPFNVSKIVFKLTKNANDLQNENNYCLFGYGYKELLIIPKPYDCYILYQNVYVVLKSFKRKCGNYTYMYTSAFEIKLKSVRIRKKKT